MSFFFTSKQPGDPEPVLCGPFDTGEAANIVKQDMIAHLGPETVISEIFEAAASYQLPLAVAIVAAADGQDELIYSDGSRKKKG